MLYKKKEASDRAHAAEVFLLLLLPLISYYTGFILLKFFYIADIAVNHHGVICIIDDKSRFPTIWFFDLFFLHVVNLNFIGTTHAGIISCKSGCFFECTVRKFIPMCFDNDMGSRSLFCMEPPVISDCKVECQFFILKIVLSDIHMITVTGNVM